MEKQVFTPNVPIQVALKFNDGRQVEGRFGDQMLYTLMDGKAMYLDMEVAAKINLLEPRRGQPFNICKRWTGKKSDSPVWDVWAIGADEQSAPTSAAQATGIPDTDIEQQLRASLAAIEAKKKAEASVRAPAPVQANAVTQMPRNGNGNKNGTNGNGLNGAPPRSYEAAGIPPPPVKIPADVAFREILGWVTEGLKAAGEQWTDQAKQDMVSTVYIQAARDGVLVGWDRGTK